MLYMIPINKSAGIEIWGSVSDFYIMSSFIRKHGLNVDNKDVNQYFKSREKIIFLLSNEMREAQNFNRKTRNYNHITFDNEKLVGFKMPWLSVILAVSCLKLNLSEKKISKIEESHLLTLLYWIENAIEMHDINSSDHLKHFLNHSLYEKNEYLYQFLLIISHQFYQLGSGKKKLKMLPSLMMPFIPGSEAHSKFLSKIKILAEDYACEIEDLTEEDIYRDIYGNKYDKTKHTFERLQL